MNLGNRTLHLGHVIDDASQMKNNQLSSRRTALQTNA